MRRSITCACVAAAAGAAFSTLGITGVSAATAAAPVPSRAAASAARAVPGTQLWVKRYNGTGNGYDAANSAAVSPAGGTVVVTGESGGATQGQNFATIGYNTATGAQLWVKRYNGPGNGDDRGNSVAISPAGDRVFVTGTSLGRTSGDDFATIAYNTATGAQLWVKRYNSPANKGDAANKVVVSPDGKKVFVSGTSRGATSGDDYVTVAYNAATGAQLWAKRYNGTGNGDDWAFSMAVSPAGTTVFVTGASRGKTSDLDYATVAYKAATGAQRWVKTYNGPGNSVDVGFAAAVSPNGGTVFVTGQSEGRASGTDFATIAYNATSGAQQWARRYSNYSSSDYFEAAMALAVSPTGNSVVVTGTSGGAGIGAYATVAYNAATGAQQWAKRYPTAGGGAAFAAAFSPDGSKVYVTGGTGGQAQGNYGTLSYNAATGAQLWAKIYDGPAHGEDNAGSLVVSPRGDKVFVTGRSTGITSGFDYATIAYSC